MKWSEWFALNTININSIPVAAGVYQIRWAVGGKSQKIHRLNGIDESGCLYIGKAVDLRSRIKRFYRGVTQSAEVGKMSNRHTAAYTYTFYGFKREIKSEHLEGRYAELPREEIDPCEEHLLLCYVEKFLDKPPLNISVKRR